MYNVLFLRLQGLTAQDPSRVNLVSAIASVGIYDGLQAAQQQFEAQGGLDRESIEREIKESSTSVTGVVVAANSVSLAGIDRVVSFRTGYTAGPVTVLGYRYRFIVANAVANVVVVARVLPGAEEPRTFREVARDIAQRQVARLSNARVGA